MKSHKVTYFVQSSSCKDCMELVMIHRKPKPKSPIRRAMWRAWWYSYVESYHKKCIADETN